MSDRHEAGHGAVFKGGKFAVCPQCGKRGVWMRLGTFEDWWMCRYCDWTAHSEWPGDEDKRAALAAANGQKEMW